MSRDAEGRSVVDVTLADSVAEFSKYSGWPELKESFMAGKVNADDEATPKSLELLPSNPDVPAELRDSLKVIKPQADGFEEGT
jgi:hypothetical protein